MSLENSIDGMVRSPSELTEGGPGMKAMLIKGDKQGDIKQIEEAPPFMETFQKQEGNEYLVVSQEKTPQGHQ